MSTRIVLLLLGTFIGCADEDKSDPNQAPVVEDVEIDSDPDPTTTASTLTCSGEAEDPDGDTLTASYT